MTPRGRRVQRVVQELFWILITCAAYAWLAIPPTLCKLIFGSPV
jgi:hypothetical protein